ncbi:MAG: CYTH domain-containing protein [Candidatus Aenigmarchaeota archaeon]|nr:CYTH domain-containing protein [Candidatus Aenigmarchaeota archaeon]
MVKKVQYKFQVEKEQILDVFKSKGIKFSSSIEHTYTYFEVPKKDKCSFIILRTIVSEGAQKMDMKIHNNKTGESKHFESSVGNIKQVQSIFKHIGCKLIFTFHKHRQTWIGEFIRLDLDTTKELGTFLEVKFDLEDRIKAEEFLRDLNIDSGKQDKRSIIEIYLEKYKS